MAKAGRLQSETLRMCLRTTPHCFECDCTAYLRWVTHMQYDRVRQQHLCMGVYSSYLLPFMHALLQVMSCTHPFRNYMGLHSMEIH